MRFFFFQESLTYPVVILSRHLFALLTWMPACALGSFRHRVLVWVIITADPFNAEGDRRSEIRRGPDRRFGIVKSILGEGMIDDNWMGVWRVGIYVNA